MRHRLLLALALAACSSPHASTPGPDASTPIPDASPDATAGFVEADHPAQPTIGTLGGAVLAAPRVVPVFFANDAQAQQQLEMFMTQMAASSYWPAISGEYGVGALTIAPSVIATEQPPTTDTALQQMITAHAGGTGGWPANTPNTIYTVFLPAGVTLSAGGAQSCVAFGGYHDETQAGVVYALVPRCQSMTFPDLQEVTIATSHELLEASTDPHPQSSPAYATVDDDHAIVQLVPGPELGDMCEYARAAFQPLVGTFMVQRTWSNASAAAGHDPCVPAMSTPYIGAAANMPSITLNVGGQFTTRGVQVAMGQSQDVEIDLFSDGETADFDVVAYDVASKFEKQAPELQLTLDHSSGHNGDKLKLTIQRIAAAQQFGISEFAVFTQVNGVNTGMWWGLVSQ
jgi:hypothetical protein